MSRWDSPWSPPRWPAPQPVVANGGVDNPDCTNAGAPCATAVHAAEVAASGDTIQIAGGVYTETVETDKVLTFVGAGGGTLDGSRPRP